MNQPMKAPQLDQLDGERGAPGVSHGGPSTKRRAVVVIALLVVIGLASAVGYWKYKGYQAREAGAAESKSLRVSSAVPARTFVEPPPKPTPPPLPGQDAKPVAAPAVAQQQAAPPALPGGSPSGSGKPLPVLDKSASSLMIDNPASKQSGEQSQAKSESANTSAQSDQGGMAAMLTGTRAATRKAGNLGDRNFFLAQGTFIDCALQTKLDTTVPGKTSCVVTRNIYSDNGKVLLVERGSTVSGEYQSNMKQGMARIFVLWDRVKTPNGVVVNLGSPGTDPLGGSGLSGYVDTHFWERFGGALMLSLVDDIARGLSSQSSGSGNQFNLNSTGDATQNMATEALRNTINIPPTLYKNQGEQIAIYVARDLDFSGVYDVAAE